MIIIHIIESSNARKQIIDLKKGVLYRKKSSIKIPKAIPLRIKRVKKEVTWRIKKPAILPHSHGLPNRGEAFDSSQSLNVTRCSKVCRSLVNWGARERTKICRNVRLLKRSYYSGYWWVKSLFTDPWGGGRWGGHQGAAQRYRGDRWRWGH